MRNARSPLHVPCNHLQNLSFRLQVLAAAIALLNNLVADDDVRATVREQLAGQKGSFHVRVPMARVSTAAMRHPAGSKGHRMHISDKGCRRQCA